MKETRKISFLIMFALIAIFSGCVVKAPEETPVIDPSILSGENASTEAEDLWAEEEEYRPEREIKYLPSGEIDTSDWQIYRNGEFGFKFMYPESFNLLDCSYNSSDLVVIYISDSKISCNDSGGRITVYYFPGRYKKETYKHYEYISSKTVDHENIDIFSRSYELVGPEGEVIESHPKIKSIYSFINIKDGYIQFSYSELFDVKNGAEPWKIQTDLSKEYNNIVKTFRKIK